ncbi:MAG: GNAT family N-acetyltransferase [Acetobacter sp.]|nr:GNAT family N-acetyltransferase [Bacteroides sp.]MCM1340559.1 GNAT family N-acetyltransferase [Acetobacter sp.]MCM1433299.1 GNAT family N-acetyltransferase [Clostridiales bacterium]
MTKNNMMNIVYNQLAVDYNCQADDFLHDDIIFTAAEKLHGRRVMPFIEPRLEVVTFGRGAVINVSHSIMSYVKKQLSGKSRIDILNSSLLKCTNPYYLPDLDNISVIENDFYNFKLIDKYEIKKYYSYSDLHNALQYNKNSERPETIGAVAIKDGKLAGIACASADSKTMWQIGVDVLPEFRGNNIAVKLVNMLTITCLERNIIPYYTTDISNINSQKVALKSGYMPAWSHCFKTRVNGNLLKQYILSMI